MKELNATSVEYLLCNLPLQLKCGHYFFRGVKSAQYLLTPSIARQKSYLELQPISRAMRERSMLADFKNRGHSLINSGNLSDWEWLALAQHHKLPTRLLDWSTNLLVALYFACEKEIGFDGEFLPYSSDSCALYMAHSEATISAQTCVDPFNCDAVGFICTPHVTQRLAGQKGVFSIQPDPTVTFEQAFENAEDTSLKIYKVIIPSQVREKLHNTLYRLGVRASSLFPDLDGLTNEIRQMEKLGCSYPFS